MRVDDYLSAIETAMTNAGDIVAWPLHLAQIAPYYGDVEAVDLHRRLRERVAQGMSDRDIGNLFVSASSGKSLLMDLIPGLKVAGLDADERVWFVEKIFDGLAAVEAGDIFCRDGAHRLFTDLDVEEALSAPYWMDGAIAAHARSAFALSGAAQAVVWSQHFYGWTDIGFVIHGPYAAGAEQLVVRDFFDLRPVALWPDAAAVPLGTLRVFSRHDASDRFTVDIFNHLLHTRAPAESCVGLRVELDGEPVVDRAIFDQIRAALVEQVRRQHATIRSMDATGVLAKFVESRYYALRGWRGDDWRPPAEVMRRLRELPLPPAPTEESWDELRVIFDPRAEWPG